MCKVRLQRMVVRNFQIQLCLYGWCKYSEIDKRASNRYQVSVESRLIFFLFFIDFLDCKLCKQCVRMCILDYYLCAVDFCLKWTVVYN